MQPGQHFTKETSPSPRWWWITKSPFQGLVGRVKITPFTLLVPLMDGFSRCPDGVAKVDDMSLDSLTSLTSHLPNPSEPWSSPESSKLSLWPRTASFDKLPSRVLARAPIPIAWNAFVILIADGTEKDPIVAATPMT